MKTKEHYENHLADFYSWMIGDFESKKNEFKTFCVEHNILPTSNKISIDLGAGNGLQTIALAELGFIVTAVDFNDQLLAELNSKNSNYPIRIVKDDIRSISKLTDDKFELVVCCGDTLTHLDSLDEIEKLIHDSYEKLVIGGKIIISFRDYGQQLEDTNRFIHVKGDDNRILTCFLEYLPDKVIVTDLLHQKIGNRWTQKVSSYYKTRLTKDIVVNFMTKANFVVTTDKIINRLVTIIGEKKV